MAWFKRMASPQPKGESKTSVPSGIWRRCDGCGRTSLVDEVAQLLQTCPHCCYHFRIGGRARLEAFLDPDTFIEEAHGLVPQDLLGFKDSKKYLDRVKAAQKDSSEEEAFLVASGRLQGHALVAGAFEFRFMGGSMGSVVGEKITRAFELATERACPVVIFSASGGARMHEGIFSLMQMAKTSAAIHRFRAVRKPYISVLTDPTTGGVAASFALLGDIILAEPGALVGFAGPRVIEQTIRQKLPEGFQRSEFLLEHGVIDQIVARPALRDRVALLLGLLGRP